MTTIGIETGGSAAKTGEIGATTGGTAGTIGGVPARIDGTGGTTATARRAATGIPYRITDVTIAATVLVGWADTIASTAGRTTATIAGATTARPV
jgi:hypothetical protein